MDREEDVGEVQSQVRASVEELAGELKNIVNDGVTRSNIAKLEDLLRAYADDMSNYWTKMYLITETKEEYEERMYG